MKGGSPNYAVAEVQGLYGPFTFSERLLQQIWDRGDFDRERLVTMDGRAVVIEHRGKWNGLGGPDFRQARIRIGGVVRTGDVELHLHAEDWAAHRHAQDPAYRNVVLHVVLFPPSATHRTIGHDGAAIPVGSLLTLLRHDLEEYAADEAVAHLSNRGGDRLREELRRLDTTEIARRLREGAMRRWQRKAHYAKVRVERLGYAAACHQTALEVLGYRFNRVPMLNLAARHPLTAWHGISADMIEAMLLDERANWARCGVRPANHPRRRLRQYAAWTAAQPDWPDVLTQLGSAWRQPGLAESTRVARQSGGLAVIRKQIAVGVCGGAIGGARLDTLMCDAFLPLLAARQNRDLAGLWWHWWAGDLPGNVAATRREIAGAAMPFCQGAAQGLLDWSITIEGALT